MDRINQNKNGVKGEASDRISIHLTGAYVMPLSENLNTTVRSFVGCSLQAGFTLLEFGPLALNIIATGSCMYHPEIDSALNVKSILIATGAVGGGGCVLISVAYNHFLTMQGVYPIRLLIAGFIIEPSYSPIHQFWEHVVWNTGSSSLIMVFLP